MMPELRALEEEAIKASNAEFGTQQASKAHTELNEAIAGARSLFSLPRLTALKNHRDKHLAHSLRLNAPGEDWPPAAREVRLCE
jgi:hypothetical protein